MKEYQVKIYSNTNVYIDTISPIDIISAISFTNTINSGQGAITLKINKLFGETTYTQGNVVKITMFDRTYPSGKQIYMGFINSINRVQTISQQYIELGCVGIFGLLSNVIFENSGSKTPTINADPGNMIKTVIDYFNTKYGGNLINYSSGFIDLFGTSVNLIFSYDTCYSAIKKIADSTTFRWYVDEIGQFHFKAKPVTSTHNLTNQLNVEQVSLNVDTQDIRNKLYLERAGGTIVTYNDAASQALYGLKETKETQSEIVDLTAQNTRGANYLTENANPKKDTSVIVNSNYTIENISPGDTIRIRNIDYPIDTVQVFAVAYSPNRVSLSLDKKISFAQQVKG